MKCNKWAAVCIQETWKLGKKAFFIDGYLILMQGHTTKTNTGRTTCGVCIILNPAFAEANKLANNKLLHLPENDQFEGRFLGATLHFKNYDNKGKRIKGITKLMLCSIYHPVDSIEHATFNNTIEHLLNSWPNNLHLLFGHDINCNVGISPNANDDLRNTTGPFGLNNQNRKGTNLL